MTNLKRKTVLIQMEVEYPEIYKDEWLECEIAMDMEFLLQTHNKVSADQAMKGRVVTYYLNGAAWVDGAPVQKLA